MCAMKDMHIFEREVNGHRHCIAAQSVWDASQGRYPDRSAQREDCNPGYIARSLHLLPRQGVSQSWLHHQDYWRDRKELPVAMFDDGALVFRP